MYESQRVSQMHMQQAHVTIECTEMHEVTMKVADSREYREVMAIGGWALGKPSGVEGAAKHYGVSTQLARQHMLTVKRCTRYVLEALRVGNIKARHAYELSKIPEIEQEKWLVPASSMTVKNLSKALRDRDTSVLVVSPGTPLDDPDIQKVVEKLEQTYSVAMKMYWVDRSKRLMLEIVVTGLPSAIKAMVNLKFDRISQNVDLTARDFRKGIGHTVTIYVRFKNSEEFIDHLWRVLDG